MIIIIIKTHNDKINDSNYTNNVNNNSNNINACFKIKTKRTQK